MIRLSDYILHKVITRKLPKPLNVEELEQKPNVVVKLDIEGKAISIRLIDKTHRDGDAISSLAGISHVS